MKNRLIAFLLIVLTLIGTIMLPVSAETQQEFVTATEYAVKNKDGDGKPYGEVVKKITDEIAAGYTELYAQTEKYQLFCNKYTGEVYLRDRATGQYLTIGRKRRRPRVPEPSPEIARSRKYGALLQKSTHSTTRPRHSMKPSP